MIWFFDNLGETIDTEEQNTKYKTVCCKQASSLPLVVFLEESLFYIIHYFLYCYDNYEGINSNLENAIPSLQRLH